MPGRTNLYKCVNLFDDINSNYNNSNNNDDDSSNVKESHIFK